MRILRKTLSVCCGVCNKLKNRNLSLDVLKCDIGPGAEIKTYKNGKITVDKFINGIKDFSLVSFGELKIGSVSFNRHDIVICREKIHIGDGCIMGPGVMIYDHDHVFSENGVVENGGYKTGEVVIGDNVWIGANTVILRDTHIGNNCVIGAGCVVKGDIPDNSLVTMNREMTVKPLMKR